MNYLTMYRYIVKLHLLYVSSLLAVSSVNLSVMERISLLQLLIPSWAILTQQFNIILDCDRIR